jgi:hypothetical protein
MPLRWSESLPKLRTMRLTCPRLPCRSRHPLAHTSNQRRFTRADIPVARFITPRPASNSHFATKNSIATSIHSSSAVHPSHSTRPASDSHIGPKKSIATSINSRSSVHHSPPVTRPVHTSGHKTPSGTSTRTSIRPSNMPSTYSISAESPAPRRVFRAYTISWPP